MFPKHNVGRYAIHMRWVDTSRPRCVFGCLAGPRELGRTGIQKIVEVISYGACCQLQEIWTFLVFPAPAEAGHSRKVPSWRHSLSAPFYVFAQETRDSRVPWQKQADETVPGM